jgi:hypothetical protein
MHAGPAGSRPRLAPWLAPAALLACAAAARADEAYFLMVFGSQQTPNNPNYAHSWATFVRAAGEGPCPPAAALEAHTISWLPASLIIRTRALHPECGHNFDLHPTVRYVLHNDERVSMWGPYSIDRELYCRALRQVGLLESGEVRYKAVDAGYPSDRVSNCIHAVSSITEGYRLRVLSPGWGEPASYFITRELEPWIVDCDQHKYKWVSTALGLDCYPIIHRDLENPRSGAIRSAGQRLLHIDNTPPATYGPPPR